MFLTIEQMRQTEVAAAQHVIYAPLITVNKRDGSSFVTSTELNNEKTIRQNCRDTVPLKMSGVANDNT